MKTRIISALVGTVLLLAVLFCPWVWVFALVVSAAAGSGKTKVLVDRLMSYLCDPVHPANIDDFLIITYTKAAATELRAKIAKALTQRIAEDPANMRLQQQFRRLYLAQISTVHSFCGDVLREFAHLGQ